ncbi:glycosyltransferase [Thalassomonas actiniarum]|uniref:Glycosyltransferase n=1 Tax=Thalassomonas actiniarum TaxID=485447 RepID=A0AAF0C4Z9_9GAMM|nr:glycosyltransferase [Thalassomonas actiniarum]WDE00539.1 glycosyltransferase [Thalassomonas actiniarum]
MQEKALVTVYIATHNRSGLLLRAVESVLNQTYPHIELIVADDGSADDTYQVLSPLIDQGKLIYLKNETPQGACVARNLAIEAASGEFITGLDDDDEFLPHRVEHMLTSFEATDYSCFASPYCERTPKGDVERRMDPGEVTLEALLHYNILGNQVMTRTEYLRTIGGFDPKMPAFQDYDTWVRLVHRYGTAFKSDNISYIWYTDHVSGRISECSDRRITAFKKFMGKHQAIMSQAHKDSMSILEKRLQGSNYSLLDFLKLTNKGNLKASVSFFMNTNFRWLKWLFDVSRLKG